jgi:hypothetical protein
MQLHKKLIISTSFNLLKFTLINCLYYIVILEIKKFNFLNLKNLIFKVNNLYVTFNNILIGMADFHFILININ